MLLDGAPREEMPAAERAARTGYLPQDAYLFSDMIRGNVLMASKAPGDGATPPSLREALAVAALDEDVQGMPDGLDTQVGEGGIRVSGGQRQRTGLARALAAATPNRPGLLVLDDPFSAVDVETEARIVAALSETFGPGAPPERRATIVLCSHRLAAFPQADLVVVLDGGPDGGFVQRPGTPDTPRRQRAVWCHPHDGRRVRGSSRSQAAAQSSMPRQGLSVGQARCYLTSTCRAKLQTPFSPPSQGRLYLIATVVCPFLRPLKAKTSLPAAPTVFALGSTYV